MRNTIVKRSDCEEDAADEEHVTQYGCCKRLVVTADEDPNDYRG